MSVKSFFALILLFGILLPSCSFYKEVVVHEVTSVEFEEFTSSGADIRVMVDIENPNSYKIRLVESHISLFLEGKPLGDVVLEDTLLLPRRSRSTQPMHVHANFGDLESLMGNVFTLLFAQELEMQGKGYVVGKALLVRKKVPFEFTEKIRPDELGF